MMIEDVVRIDLAAAMLTDNFREVLGMNQNSQCLRRRGTSAMLAMLYLVLFASMATGFYAAFNMASQISYNDREARRALAAAESGMEFIRFHLWSLDIEHHTPPDELFDRVFADLAAQLDGSANLGGGSIAQNGERILIPGDPNRFISLKSGDCFRIEIERAGKELLVFVIGQTAAGVVSAGPTSTLRMRYGIFERPSSIFDFGVASRSAINMVGNTDILGYPDPSSGSVLSTASVSYPLTMGSNCGISGEVSFSSPGAWVDAGANSVINNEVGEANWADNVHEVNEPDFPAVDTTDFAALAVNTITSSSPTATSYTNIRVPAGLNPVFNSDVALKGVIYVEEPNVVKFNGHVTVTGVVVVENNDGSGWEKNSIKFLGGATATGPEGLPAEDPQFAELREMNGAFLLAPGFAVTFGGNSDTNVSGSVVASSINFSGTGDAVVTGSVMNLEESSSVYFSGNASVTIRSSGTRQQPHGLYFGSRYSPLPGSYEEVIR